MGSAEGTAFGTGSASQKVLPTTNLGVGGSYLEGGPLPKILWAMGRLR